ncbi:ATPase, T2SS/T4P/T4SS family [Curtobacterium sp. MCSS17_016]|uniref:ATPase, T2SS/T4P/T4SS family n=1 Tax=Curtobacterium sp. MCSS17_016 TaxID=2175644 RepID=UPI000DA82C0C|nr:ATPase, T2SS/T4P/T4SS family [Curtobacterium sp. MCSS17_016]WIE80835.1 ATPase, T2SS/T4P/T4SS family [Curtobacterium sp. MCSS17_016]
MTPLRPFIDREGLIIVTGRPGAGKSATALTAAGDSCRAGRAAWTVEEHPAGEYPGLVRLPAPVDGAFDDVSRTLLRAVADVIVLDDVFDAPRAAFATRLALTGRTVVAVVSASDVLEALDWFTELATRDDATELGVYTAVTAVVRVGPTPDVFVNTRAATEALIAGRPASEVRAAGG